MTLGYCQRRFAFGFFSVIFNPNLKELNVLRVLPVLLDIPDGYTSILIFIGVRLFLVVFDFETDHLLHGHFHEAVPLTARLELHGGDRLHARFAEA